jgi:hypothetical protein
VGALGLLMSIAVVGTVFLSPYLSRGEDVPLGGDTKKYIWRSNLAIESGLDALTHIPQQQFWTNPDRPGFPALAALLHGATGVTPLQLAYFLPALMAVAVGMAAGAFAVGTLREPPWAFPIFAIGVGASVQLVITVVPVGYMDNLVVDALVTAAATAVVAAATGRPGAAAAILLLAAAAVVHWPFTLTFSAVVMTLAVALIPASVLVARRGTSVLSTPSVRLTGLLAGSLLAGAGALAMAPAFPTRQPRVGASKLAGRFSEFLPRFRLPFFIPAAAAGVGFLVRPRDRRRRWGLLLAMIWAGSALAAVIALRLGIGVPAYRVLAFALGIPILAAAALSGVARILWARLRWAGAVTAVVLVGAALAAGIGWAHDTWSAGEGTMTSEQFDQLATASRYLEGTAKERPVIFTTDRLSGRRGTNVVRAGLTTDLLRRSLVYLGDPQRLLAGRPTLVEGDHRYNSHSLAAWTDVKPALERRPIVLFLSSLNRATDVAGTPLGPGIFVVRGPDPVPGSVPARFAAPGPPQLVGLAAASLAVLGVAGAGWSVSLVRDGWVVRAALAPPLGIAVLVLAGVLGNRLGAGLGTGPAAVLAVGAAAAGWIPLVYRRVRARFSGERRDGAGPPAPPRSDAGTVAATTERP